MRSLLILILALETSANIIAQDDGKLLFADGGRHKYSTEYREWRDASGNFAVIAKFDRFLPADHVRLIRKNEDKPADVKIEILSPQDQELLNQIRKLIEKEAAGDNEARLAKGVWGRRIDFDAKAGEGGRYVTINGRTNLPPETKLQASMTPKWPIDEQCLPLHRPNLLKKGNYVTPSHVTKSGEGTVDEAGNFEIQIFFKDDSKLKYGEYHVFVSYLGGFMNTVTEKEIYEFLDGEGVSSGRERRVLAQVYRVVTILDTAIKRGGFVGSSAGRTPLSAQLGASVTKSLREGEKCIRDQRVVVELDRAVGVVLDLIRIASEDYDRKVAWPQFVADKQNRYNEYRSELEKSLQSLNELAEPAP